MYILVLWSAKLIQFITRKIGHGGSALPGLLVEKISKNFLKHFLNKIPEGVVVISGTNGKTTTSKLIVEALEMSGKKVFTNRSGSNMTRGLISAVISHADALGRMPYDIAILEVDEAYAAKLASDITIKGALILNVMRDQLDRFGEIDNTSKLLSELSKSAQGFVVLNADDSRVNTLPSFENAKRSFFGLSSNARKQIISEEDLHT